MLVLAKAPGKLQGVKRHPGPGHDARPVPTIPQTLSLSRRTRRWALACTPLPGPPAPPLTYCGGRTPTPQSTAGRPASGLPATGRSAPRRTRSPAVLRSSEGMVGCPEKGRASSQQCLPGRTTHEHTRSHPRNAERGTRDAHPRTRARTHTPPRPEPRTARFPGLQLVAHQELMQYHAHTITEKFYAVFCQVFLYNSFITSLTASIKIPGILYQQPSLY